MAKPAPNRRSFIKSSALGILGAGIFPHNSVASARQEQENDPPSIREYRILGRTGLKVSDLGTGAPTDESLLRAVLKSGVNFIETSEMYSRGQNEKLIGNVLQDFEREKLVIATKVSHGVKEFVSSGDIIDRVNASLERMQTHYVDCLMIHGAESTARVKNKYFHQAVKQLKKQGKIRFTGLSCHGHRWWDNPEESFEQVLLSAIDDGRYDVVMLPYNFFEPEMSERVLSACAKNNIGTMIMKSNPILLYDLFNQLKEETEKEGKELSERYRTGHDRYKKEAEFAREFFTFHGIEGTEKMKDAAIQFVLSNENVNTICCLFTNYNDVGKYIRLSGTRLSKVNAELLTDFKYHFNSLHCRIGCNVCEEKCPHHVPVNTILRYHYYFRSKGQEKYAMQLYGDLPEAGTHVCADCEGFCERACPYGVLTRPMLAFARQDLHFV